MFKNYKKIAASIFGSFADKYVKSFETLKPYIMSSNIGILLRTWICMILFSVLISYVVSLIITIIITALIQFDFILSVYMIIFFPLLASSLVFMVFYIYPIQKTKSLERSIENNMPFVLAHMSAIASAGVQPEYIFELLSGFDEYGAISKQANLIVRNIKTFGMSSISAIENVAKKTPSESFRQLLIGITSTIEKGGDIVKYMNEMSEKALFDYKIKREQYLKTLSMYADIYTALLVAAPLIMLAVLGVMSIIGGDILGFTIQELITMITWIVLPVLNISFLTFIHITYPGV